MKTPFKLLSLVLSALTVMSASSAAFATPINIENPTCKKVLKYGLIGAGATAATLLTAAGAYKLFGSKTAEMEIEINSEEDFNKIQDCRDSITKVILNIETIKPNAFEYCPNLKEVDLHGVKYIGHNAFISCSKLTTVINSSNVQFIDNFAFCNCSALKEIDLPNVSAVKTGAFFRCKSLNKINLSSVKLISDNAFTQCTSLKNVALPENSKNLAKIISSQKNKDTNSGKINFIYKQKI